MKDLLDDFPLPEANHLLFAGAALAGAAATARPAAANVTSAAAHSQPESSPLDRRGAHHARPSAGGWMSELPMGPPDALFGLIDA